MHIGRERGGPGLGLALVKALVELHEGWITLESEPNEGASFKIHLPGQTQSAQTLPVAAENAAEIISSPEVVDSEDSGDHTVSSVA